MLTDILLYVRGFYSNTHQAVRQRRRSPPSTLVSRGEHPGVDINRSLSTAAAGLSHCVSVWVTSHWQTVDHKPLLSSPHFSSLCFAQAAQQVKACSNTPPAAGRVYEPRPEREEQRIREGGNPRKKIKQHDSACFNRLACTAFTLNTSSYCLKVY